tara:strand:+ start:8929 stop:9282 length:354 start_codon:yes stop_codon:yes gene_type:complete
MDNITLKGSIVKIKDLELKGVTNFKVREFWLHFKSGKNEEYSQTVTLQTTGDRTELLDKLKLNEVIVAHINIKGNIWQPKDGGEERVFNSLDCWKIETQGEENKQEALVPEEDDLPF